jgi:hypothetical protein
MMSDAPPNWRDVDIGRTIYFGLGALS